ncbi:hypothetical protein ACFVWP_46930 [Streptomyces sp. NPDC058175]|uniref:hypothetical protein n=1 Tax=Streptomyces sp. NPDC058175 TaxID=3346367 RepID=UPI0036EE269C
MGLFSNRVVNTGVAGAIQDSPGEVDDDFMGDFMDGFTATGRTGVINTGVRGDVQNSSGPGNTQSISRRR